MVASFEKTQTTDSANQSPRIDREQVLRQLELLGQKPEEVYITAFFPKGDPRTKGENSDRGRKATQLNYSQLEGWQAEGRGIYLVVNGYGHKKEEVKLCRAIFYEHDKLDKEIQLNLWQTLALPEPTFQIETGGKSIHSYWVFEEPITPDQWSEKNSFGQWQGIQADLLRFADADRSLTNPNRIMRLAGAWYCTHDDEKGTHAVAQSKIVGGCEKRYTYEELRAAIPVREYKVESKTEPLKSQATQQNTPPSNSKGNGIDFRSISHLIPTWDQSGRKKGFATFQCPVHTNDSVSHSDDHIHVHLSTGKWIAHCGCQSTDVYRAVREMYAPYTQTINPKLGKQISKEEHEMLKTKAEKDSAKNNQQIEINEKAEGTNIALIDLIEAKDNPNSNNENNKVIAKEKPHHPVEKSNLSKDNSPEKITKKIKKAFCQEVYENLFQDNNYIYVHNQFHEWTGTHYEPIAIAVITKKIHDYCDNYEVPKEKTITYPYAAPSFVTMALNWLKQKFGIDPKLVNPPGLNCIDGILQLSFDPDSKTLIKILVPHDPSFYYLYAPQATYHISPITLPDPCNRLLSCLDAPQRDIFLKTIGAAFDLPTVRRYKGRGIKALLLHGTGSNGKDTLRHVTSMMFGKRGMVSVAFGDFIQYDQGRKFPAQKLDGALVNWPSENGDDVTLDKIQSLKIAITGDSLSGEKKGKDEYEFNPKCVNLFNYNLPPKLQGSMQAILDRFAILKFNKTYKTKPAPGELQADPRFLYDDDFVRTEVLPWYLYYCLDALERLMKEGVNYDVTEQAWEDLRAESDHIYAFCQEVGIGYKRSGQLNTDEVWRALMSWYIENGTLQITTFPNGGTKYDWNPNPAFGDNLIKGKNQIFARLLKIFPEARRERDSNGRSILVGVGWNLPTPPDGKNVSTCYTSEDGLKQSEDGLKMLKPLQNQRSEDAEDVLTDSVQKNKFKIEESCGCGGQCPACVAESAYNLANAMHRCESGKEVRELLEQYSHLSEAAWRSLTEEGHDHVRDLLLKLEVEESELKPEDYKEGSPPPHHLQHLQNADSIKVSTSSDHLQPSSDHLQNCSDSIQNEPIDFSDIITRTNIEIKRLGWTKEEGKAYLRQTYGKRSRQLLSDSELVDFLNYLQSLPKPQPENSVGDEEVQPEQVELIEETGVEENSWHLPELTDVIENAEQLEFFPVLYGIEWIDCDGVNASIFGCVFVQRVGNICQFESDEVIDIEVDEKGNFLGGVTIQKME